MVLHNNKSTQLKTGLKPIQKKLSKSEVISINNDVTDAYNDYNGALSKRALFKTSDVDVSQDIVQMTFMKTLLYLRKGGKIKTMQYFLNHILNNLIIDEYRKRKTISLDSLLEKGFKISSEDSEQMIDILDGKKAILLIPLLPKRYRTVIHMRYVQNLKYKEISLLTNQLPNTAAVQVHRGLAKLKILYDDVHT
ncbi:MAG: sigma-70 family RNA polymerase sigma factor [Candidatus Paceibacterota bacterium]